MEPVDEKDNLTPSPQDEIGGLVERLRGDEPVNDCSDAVALCREAADALVAAAMRDIRAQAHAEGYAAGLKKAMTLVESYSDLVPTGAMTAAISEEIQKCLTR